MSYRNYNHIETGIQFSVPHEWAESYGQVLAATPLEVRFQPPDLSAMMQFTVRTVTEIEDATFEQLEAHVSSNAFTYRYQHLRTIRLTLGLSKIPAILSEFVSGFLFWKRRNWLITFVAEGIQPILRIHAPMNRFSLHMPAFLEAARTLEFRTWRGFELGENCDWFSRASGLQRIGTSHS